MANKLEVAAFLANVGHESGDLCFINEISPASDYCAADHARFPCAPGKSYHGRGGLQLSWNYNYGEDDSPISAWCVVCIVCVHVYVRLWYGLTMSRGRLLSITPVDAACRPHN